TKAGETLEADFPYQRGGPVNPMSAEEIRTKFEENASLALDDGALDALESALLTLEEQDDLTSVFAPLAAAKVAAGRAQPTRRSSRRFASGSTARSCRSPRSSSTQTRSRPTWSHRCGSSDCSASPSPRSTEGSGSASTPTP